MRRIPDGCASYLVRTLWVHGHTSLGFMGRGNQLLFLFCFLFGLAVSSAFAWPPTYGAEFEFTTQEMLKDTTVSKIPYPKERVPQLKLVAALRKKCERAGCTVTEVDGKYGGRDFVVTLKDGWWFKVSVDAKVVEIQTKPATLDEWRALKPIVNEFIFQTASNSGLTTKADNLAGHFNTGAKSAFGDDPKALLRFFVDYANHPELGLGVFGRDLANAAPLSLLSSRPRTALQKIVDSQNDIPRDFHLADMANRIQTEVYTEGYKPEWGAFHHYQAFGMKKIVEGRWGADKDADFPFELRATRGQQSAEDFILVAELMEMRMAFVNKQKGPIVYLGLADRPMTESDLVSRFYVWVTEMGGDYEKYKSLLPARLKGLKPDLFLTRDMEWKEARMLNSLKPHLPYLATSEWLRERIVKALKKGKATEAGGVEILNLIVKRLATASRQERAVVEPILSELFNHPTWSGEAGEKAIREFALRQPLHWDSVRRLLPASWRELVSKPSSFWATCAMPFRWILGRGAAH